MALEQIGLQAILEDKNFQQGLKRYTDGVGQMTKLTDGAASAISGAFKIATGALLVGAGAAVAILGTSLKAAADAEQVAAATDAVLKSTKGVAGLTTQAVTDLATALSEVTPFEDDAVQGGENLLLTFTNIGKNVFPLATETVLDMSQAMGQDLKSSAIQLGKALNDPAQGLSALSRVGVQFTKQQEDLVKQLVATGKTEEAQRVILKELQTEFGGAARAAGKTFAGQMQILQNSIGNVQEEIGAALLPIAQELVTWITYRGLPVLKDLSRWFTTQAMPQIRDLAWRYIPPLIDAFRSLADWVQRDVLPVVQQFTDWIQQDAVRLVKQLWGAINDLAFGFSEASGDFSDFYTDISNLMGSDAANFFTSIAEAVKRIADAFNQGGITAAVGQMATEIQNAWPTISAQLATWKDQFWNWLTGPGGAIYQAAAQVGQVAQKIADWLNNNWDGLIVPTLQGWTTSFWSWLTGKGGVLDTVATNMTTLTDAIYAWTQESKTRIALQDIGKNIAITILEGMGNLFKSDQTKSDSAMSHLIESLNQARINLAESIASVGADIMTGVVKGGWELLSGDKLTTRTEVALNAWMQAGAKAFVAEDPVPLAVLIIDSVTGAMYKEFGDKTRGDVLGQWMGYYFNLGVNYFIGPFGPMIQAIQRIFATWDTAMASFHWTMPWDQSPTPPAPPAPTWEPGVVGYQQGGYVPRNMLARLHAGEYVIPASRVSHATYNSRSIGAVTVTIQGSTGMGASAIKQAVYEGISEVLGKA